MVDTDKLTKLIFELETGMSLKKCRQCGCMKGALEEIRTALENADENATEFKKNVNGWIKKKEESAYT